VRSGSTKSRGKDEVRGRGRPDVSKRHVFPRGTGECLGGKEKKPGVQKSGGATQGNAKRGDFGEEESHHEEQEKKGQGVGKVGDLRGGLGSEFLMKKKGY